MCSSNGIQIQFKKIAVLAKQNPPGHNVACRLPGCHNVGIAGKHGVKEEIRVAQAKLARSARSKCEGRLNFFSCVFLK